MISCGLDLGSGSTKGVLLEDGRRILAIALQPTRGRPVVAARAVVEALAEEANLLPGDIEYTCTTGFGRYTYPERDLQVSDITSSARGAVFLHPGTHHVLDIGSQSSRATAISDTGKVLKFKLNEKCAAGAGRFVERCSKYLQVPLDEMGPRAVGAREPKLISSVCAVLAETEIINNVAESVPLPDILMGVYLSLAQRAHALMRYVGIRPDVTLVGGMVASPGMVEAIRQTVGIAPVVPAHGQYAAAIGAAQLGTLRAERRGSAPTAGAS